jgi:putative Mg2+ transporter-C (MgtC) family protein
MQIEPVTQDLFSLPGTRQVVTVVTRLVVAALLGGLIGAEREAVGKAAGLRTHMLVALGAALFVIAPAQAGLGEGDVGRIIQGVAAGIGFIGAGTILKLTDREEIKGLTTAASIWLTAAIGIATAVGPLWVSIVSAACAWAILYGLGKVETRRGSSEKA